MLHKRYIMIKKKRKKTLLDRCPVVVQYLCGSFIHSDVEEWCKRGLNAVMFGWGGVMCANSSRTKKC